MEQIGSKIQAPVRHVEIVPARRWAALELQEIWHFRDLLVLLMMRDVKLRYKQTALGIVWVILQPLIASLIFAVIFGRFANLPSNGIPYLLFVFAGMLPWNLFAGALQRAGNSLVGDSKLISKVYFPRMVIPIAS
jgi:lipopolysaccharide transport system permease protein